MKLLERKIDTYLQNWKNNPEHKPLVVKGARQVGKTESVYRKRRELEREKKLHPKRR